MKRVGGSVRFRVTALATLAVLVVLGVAGSVLVIHQKRLLTENLEEHLVERANEIAAIVATGDVPPTLAGPSDDDSITQVVTSNGRVVASSPNVAGRPPVADAPPAGREDVIRSAGDVPGGEGSYLVLSRRVDDTVIHVASSRDDIAESTNILAGSLTAAIPMVAAVLALLIWWLVGRTLRPVEAIRAEVADIGGSDLHRRVPEPATTDEIARLARTMNAMLERVEDASLRQQRFVADAAHELRTPLTRIRSELEVDLAHPDHAAPGATHRSILEETVGLQHLVDDLLHLARADAAVAVPGEEAVDLDDIVLRHARRLREDGRVAVDTSRVTAAQVRGDPDQLNRVVGNVTSNAARHASGRVTFALQESDGCAVLTISDDGPGIAPEERERVFDRFTRLDSARANSTGGTGLGLAIARDIVERHGGTITIDAAHRPGAAFVVRLPLENGHF